MFDSVLGRSLGAPGRPALGAAVSLSLHLVAFALALALATRASAPPPIEIIHFPPHPKGPAHGPARPGPTEPPVRPEPLRPRTPVKPLALPSPAPEAASPTSETERSTAGASGQPGPAEACASEPCGAAGGPGSDVRLLEAHMTPPQLLSAPAPTYPPQAARERIGGTVSVRCTVTIQRTVEDCQVLRGLPLVEGPILEALRARRYAPAQEDGRPVAVRMVFTVRVVPP
jgi:periplasmic protein TonB